MKKIFLMITFLAAFTVFAKAQTKAHKTPEQKAQRITRMLQKKLVLSDDQSARVNAILLKNATQIDSLKQTRTAENRKQIRQSRKAILLNTDEQLKTVFTASQQKTYEELKTTLKERAKTRKAEKAPSAS